MRSPEKQGQSGSTAIKQASLTAIVESLIYPYLAIQKEYNEPVVFIETNAGCGFNKKVQIEGSPVIFGQAIDRLKIRSVRLFCDNDADALKELENKMGYIPFASYHCVDNRDFIKGLPEKIVDLTGVRDIKYARGLVYVDPNGVTDGFPLTELVEFSRIATGIDIVINHAANTAKRSRGAFKDRDYPDTGQIIKMINKPFSAVRSPHGSSQWTMILLSSYKSYKISGVMRSHGFTESFSDKGKMIIAKCRLNKTEYVRHLNDTGYLFETI